MSIIPGKVGSSVSLCNNGWSSGVGCGETGRGHVVFEKMSSASQSCGALGLLVLLGRLSYIRICLPLGARPYLES